VTGTERGKYAGNGQDRIMTEKQTVIQKWQERKEEMDRKRKKRIMLPAVRAWRTHKRKSHDWTAIRRKYRQGRYNPYEE
jgi:hypothetical protein